MPQLPGSATVSTGRVFGREKFWPKQRAMAAEMSSGQNHRASPTRPGLEVLEGGR
jgi:hypothetical protein